MKASILNLVSIRDRDLHARRRSHWIRGLNSTSIKDYEPLINKRVQQLTDLLARNEGFEIDLSQILSYFAYDFMGDMA
jgi:cytochrome P450